MIRSTMLLLLTTFGALSVIAQPNTKFEPGCKLPFDAIKGEGLAIDSSCGGVGSVPVNSPFGKQNKAKNNFCATGDPIPVTFKTFDRLQQAAVKKGVKFGKSLPAKREVLQKLITTSGKNLGEGVIVTLEGFVLDARHSNTKFFTFNGKPSDGESVNCNSGELDRNDIHIELSETAMQAKQKLQCQSVTAEISPHFRPARWDRFDVNPKTMAAAKGIAQLKGARVRITGPLFFDASHTPQACGTGTQKGRGRRTIWEIHPVYAIEVFDTVTNQFLPLDQWAEGSGRREPHGSRPPTPPNVRFRIRRFSLKIEVDGIDPAVK